MSENMAPNLGDNEPDPEYVDNDPDQAPASDLPQDDRLLKNDPVPLEDPEEERRP